MPNRVQVAIVALLLLLAILVLGPVLQMMREAEGRIGCTNRLKQIGLALHNYCDSHGTFPSGTVANSHLPPERRLSWVLLVWPYVEARPRLLVDRTKAWDDDENRDPKEHLQPPKSPEDKVVPVGE